MKHTVTAGVHVHNGRVYKAGETFESPIDLRPTFANKFVIADAGTPVTKQAGTRGTSVGGAPAAKQPAEPEGEKGDQGGGDGKAKDEGKGGTPKGADVTAEFDKAKDEDMVVYKSRGAYYVYDADDLTKPLNADGVKKGEVDKVITDALKK